MPNPLVLMSPLPPEALLFLGILGLGVGFLSGLLGIGGGLQMVPGLILIAPYFLGGEVVTVAAATGIAAVQALASSTSSTAIHLKNGVMKKRFVFLFGVPAIIGGYLGSYFSADWPRQWLLMILLVALSATLILGARKYINTLMGKKPTAEISEFVTDWLQLWSKRFIIVPYALFIGAIAGVVGMGGAVFFVPFMTEVLKLPVRQAIITATGVVIMTSIGSVLGKAQAGIIPWEMALGISAIAFVGGAIGAIVQAKVHNKHLRLLHIGLVGWALFETARKLFF